MSRPARHSLIPLRHGVSASCVAQPSNVAFERLLDFLAHRLTAIDRHAWALRMAQGDVLDESGLPLPPDAPCRPGARVYYYRHIDDEPVVPFEETVLHQDAHLVVADKPHFLPVTPGGRYVQQTLLVRLKRRLGLPELSPVHRIDRETAGLVVFSVRPQDRAAYQALFRERTVDKVYEAIAPHTPRLATPQRRCSRIVEEDGAFFRMTEAPGEPNSETTIALLEQRGPWARYRLEPVTGKRHQLRVHMNALGLPIVGDQFYPRVLRGPDEAEDFREPLRLLAQAIAFTDPVTGEARRFESGRGLQWPVAEAG
ncbi:MAG: pseudouridine synthase [Hydrogenophaga sp.]|jgi:tRNA pseudouridine32 synthase/23S rRNA pseudouridine746 synthase|nr:pseudouridine synthase [Hydrogenophaga sp.]